MKLRSKESKSESQSEGPVARLSDALARRVAALKPREQTLLAAGAVVLLLALVVSVGVLPAWRSLQQGPARQQALNVQVARMAQWEAQAQALKSRPVLSGTEAATKLQVIGAGLAGPVAAAGGASAQALQLKLSPQQASATLRALPAESLAAWLSAARVQAHAVPSDAKLTREADPAGAAEGAASASGWSGTLVLRLPP